MRWKWILISACILSVIIAGTSVYAYKSIRSTLSEQYVQAEVYALESELTEVKSVDYYHGSSAYYVVQGVNADSDDMIMWIADDFKSHHLKKEKDGIDIEEAVNIVKESEEEIEIKSIRLGYERNLPIYEVMYVTKDGRKGYYYITFSDGTFLKKYLLRTD